jgi:hypothetical protein
LPRRVTLTAVLALVVVVVGLLAAGAAQAATDIESTTWDQAAADARFPVFQPTQTLGLAVTSVTTYPCSVPPLPRKVVSAVYGTPKRSSKRPFFSLTEVYPNLCGNDGEAKPVARRVINGVTADVLVNCANVRCRVTAKDGFKNGFQLYLRRLGAKRTRIEVAATHVSLRNLLRIARSLTRVSLTKRTLQLRNFLSPDGTVWCQIVATSYADYASCGTRTPRRSGEVKRDGSISLCDVSAATDPRATCYQNWDFHAPVLGYGQASELDGYRCASEMSGITCTLTDPGPAKGKGFVINAAGVTAIGV